MFAIVFALAAAAPEAATAAPADPLDKVRCVREEVIGSLVESRKVCHTVREWHSIHNDSDAETRRVIESGQRMVTPG